MVPRLAGFSLDHLITQQHICDHMCRGYFRDAPAEWRWLVTTPQNSIIMTNQQLLLNGSYACDLQVHDHPNDNDDSPLRRCRPRRCYHAAAVLGCTANRLIPLKRPRQRFRRLFRLLRRDRHLHRYLKVCVLPGIAWARDHAPRWGWKCPRRWPSFGTGHS